MKLRESKTREIARDQGAEERKIGAQGTVTLF